MGASAETSLHIATSLVSNMAVVVVVAYVITRTQSHVTQVLNRQYTLSNQAFLVIVFGLFSIYGTMTGIDFGGALATIRDLGPATAGLLGGPWLGLGAGLIGGIHRFFYDGAFTKIPCSLSTVLIGLAAGLVQRRLRRDYIGVPGAILFMAIAESFHMGMVLLIARPFEQALKVVGELYGPMALANCGGMAVFALIIANLRKERKVQQERDSFLQAKERIESELRVARDIQMQMVPKVFREDPPWPEYDLYASVTPAKEVGGDLYDFFPLGPRHLFFAVGDVSDKGVPAALFMAMTKTLLKGLARVDQPPSDLLSRVNWQISSENDALMFCTLVCGVLDTHTGIVTFANAGHNPPLHLRADGSAEWVRLPSGLALGIDGAAEFEVQAQQMGPGDTLVLYTDGVTEAMSTSHAQFREQGLQDTAKAAAGSAPEALVGAIASAVTVFAGGEPQSDDITVLALRYNGAAQEAEADPRRLRPQFSSSTPLVSG